MLRGPGERADRDRRHGCPISGRSRDCRNSGSTCWTAIERPLRRRPRLVGDSRNAVVSSLMHGSKRRFDGFFIDELEFRVDQFRIPPRELGEMLPQQSLMLRVAAEAIEDARWDERLALSTGVLIGIGLDLNTTNYHLRWSLAGQVRQWKQTLALGLSDEELENWIDELKNAAGPALSANRTIGSLGAWSPAGLPASFGSAGRASRSPATRLRASRPWRSRRRGSSGGA